jgi:hypothetical protein
VREALHSDAILCDSETQALSYALRDKVVGLAIGHGEQTVLAALCAHADDNGGSCFPSVGRLSWETNYSERQVQYIIRNLEDLGIVRRVTNQQGGRGMVTHYQIDIEKAPQKPAFREKDATTAPIYIKERVQSATSEPEKGCNLEQERVQNPSERVQFTTQKGATIAPEPVSNQSENKSMNLSGGSDTPRKRVAAPKITDEIISALETEYGPQLDGSHKARDAIIKARGYLKGRSWNITRLREWLDGDVEKLHMQRRNGNGQLRTSRPVLTYGGTDELWSNQDSARTNQPRGHPQGQS